jgi:hypothetical protein
MAGVLVFIGALPVRCEPPAEEDNSSQEPGPNRSALAVFLKSVSENSTDRVALDVGYSLACV